MYWSEREGGARRLGGRNGGSGGRGLLWCYVALLWRGEGGEGPSFED